MFSKIQNIILDTLFPIQCLSCQKDDFWLCSDCFKKINILTSQVCPYCEKNMTPGGVICQFCRLQFLKKNQLIPLEKLILAASYTDKKISRLIHLFKYNFISDLSFPLGKIVTKSLLNNNLPLPDFIIPVPLHKRRLRWRGFNQSELLAEFIGQNLTPGFPIPVLGNFILRKRYTKPQMKIGNFQERKENIKNAFKKGSFELNLKDKTVLLIDDVATTGATLFECGRILKQNGAKSVWGAVIARQEMK